MKNLIETIRKSRNLKIIFVSVVITITSTILFIFGNNIFRNYAFVIKLIAGISSLIGLIFLIMEGFNVEFVVKKKEFFNKITPQNNFLKQLFSTRLITIDSGNETKLVEIYELKRNGNFAQYFASLGYDLNKICFTEDEIESFCERYPDYLFRKNSYVTFFLTKRDHQFFVKVITKPCLQKYYINEGKFADDYVWMAELGHYLVIPDQSEIELEQSADMLKEPFFNILYFCKKG